MKLAICTSVFSTTQDADSIHFDEMEIGKTFGDGSNPTTDPILSLRTPVIHLPII